MSFGNLWSNSYAKFAILDITFPSPCGWLDSGLKHCKVSKYYDQDWWFDRKRKLSLSFSKTLSLTHKTPYFPYNEREIQIQINFLKITKKKQKLKLRSVLMYNHFHNILKHFNVWPSFSFATNETKRDYY